MKLSQWFIWLVIIVVTTSCGFHLREVSINNLPLIYINGGNHNTGIRINIERMLRNSQQRLTATREQAEVVLQLMREDYQRRPLSISRQLLVQEYELIYTVEFQVTDVTGKIRVDPQSIILSRDYSFSDTNQVLGKGNEESLLRQEMLHDASRQILAHIGSLS